MSSIRRGVFAALLGSAVVACLAGCAPATPEASGHGLKLSVANVGQRDYTKDPMYWAKDVKSCLFKISLTNTGSSPVTADHFSIEATSGPYAGKPIEIAASQLSTGNSDTKASSLYDLTKNSMVPANTTLTWEEGTRCDLTSADKVEARLYDNSTSSTSPLVTVPLFN